MRLAQGIRWVRWVNDTFIATIAFTVTIAFTETIADIATGKICF